MPRVCVSAALSLRNRRAASKPRARALRACLEVLVPSRAALQRQRMVVLRLSVPLRCDNEFLEEPLILGPGASEAGLPGVTLGREEAQKDLERRASGDGWRCRGGERVSRGQGGPEVDESRKGREAESEWVDV